MLPPLDVVWPAADQRESLVDGAVEQHVVIGHVEMAIVIDPAALDPHAGGDERRKEQRFEIDAIKHTGALTATPATDAMMTGFRSKRNQANAMISNRFPAPLSF